MTELKLQKQRYLHRPEEGTFGDCHRTCIASLLGLDRDEVPNWGLHYKDGDAFDKACTEYLASQGLRRIVLPLHTENGRPEEALEWMKRNNPSVYYLLTGQSKNGTNHVVIAKDDAIVWDPSLDNSGIVSGCQYDGEPTNWFWIDIHIPNSALPHRAAMTRPAQQEQPQ